MFHAAGPSGIDHRDIGGQLLIGASPVAEVETLAMSEGGPTVVKGTGFLQHFSEVLGGRIIELQEVFVYPF